LDDWDGRPIAINLRLEYPISNTEQQSRNQFCNHGTHGIHRKILTTKHTKKTIVNFLLRKKLTIDFVKNVQKKQEYYGLYYGMSNNEVKTKCMEVGSSMLNVRSSDYFKVAAPAA
jgi:hypothetical protein